MKIIQQSYEEARLCFFKAQRKIAERKLEYWMERTTEMARGWMEERMSNK